MSVLNSHEIVEETLNWHLDFGLVEGDASTLPQGLLVEKFAYDELVLVVSPQHQWSKRSAVKPMELAEDVLLLREQGSGIREVVERGLLLHGVQIHPLFTLTDNEAIKQMVMSSVGAAIVSAYSVRRELENGDLVQVAIADLDLKPQLSLIRRTDKQLSRAALAFCTFLLPAFNKEGELAPASTKEE
jgi:DNA-binding transcriptional LysR family regulator